MNNRGLTPILRQPNLRANVKILGMNLYEEVFKEIESLNQAYLPIKNLREIKVPDEPLYVITPVENSNGKIKLG